MRQHADGLKGRRKKRPATFRTDRKPDKRCQQQDVNRGNAVFDAGEHACLQQRCGERRAEKHGGALALGPSTSAKGSGERGQKQC